MVVTLFFFTTKSLLIIERDLFKEVDIMNEINFVFDKFNSKSYLESNISDNKKVKEIVSISFQLYLINELYKDNLITKNEYHKLYSSIKISFFLNISQIS